MIVKYEACDYGSIKANKMIITAELDVDSITYQYKTMLKAEWNNYLASLPEKERQEVIKEYERHLKQINKGVSHDI